MPLTKFKYQLKEGECVVDV